MQDTLSRTLSEIRDERVDSLNPTHGYTLLETMQATGWSRSYLYLVMVDGRLPYHYKGKHRRIKGKDIKHLYNY